ncbi:MAG: AMP-dependent synthetase, partial [Muribaculaceae bacterium]|nr:AMP-dependent synthetase [Muribaculaceae bacterium]
IKTLIVGGGAIPSSVEKSLRQLPTRIYATYGMTETCSHVALRDVSAGNDFYEALPHASFSQNNNGTLTIHCHDMSFGSLTTTDVVELLSPTRFRWLGRLDNAINSGGIKIHPETVEAKISSLVDAPFYLTGRKSDRWGEELVMYVEGSIDRDRFMTAARIILSRYELPKAIIAVERFQRTASGKIKRVLL